LSYGCCIRRTATKGTPSTGSAAGAIHRDGNRTGYAGPRDRQDDGPVPEVARDGVRRDRAPPASRRGSGRRPARRRRGCGPRPCGRRRPRR